jgi:thiamine biosynthesis lipoprotein
VTLRDKALSTSGNSPGYTGHVVNPKTGMAVEDKILTAVVCDDPLEAEVLSTTLMMADGGQRKKLRGRFPECEFGIYEL